MVVSMSYLKCMSISIERGLMYILFRSTPVFSAIRCYALNTNDALRVRE